MAAAGCWIIVLISLGCRSGSRGKILSQDTMRVVLMEMLKADAYNDFRSIKDTNYKHDTAYALLYANIFGSHRISKEQFSDSYNYYMSRPADFKALIDSMSNQANRDLAKEKPASSKGYVPPAGGAGHRPPGGFIRPNGTPGHPFIPAPGHTTIPSGPTLPPGHQAAPAGGAVKPIIH
jgi:hypothetical protein